MWYVVQWVGGWAGLRNPAADLWPFVIAFGVIFTINSMQWWGVRHLVGLFLWTDILNMASVEFFNTTPTFWWAYGWTIGMLPVIGWLRVTLPIWAVMLWIHGDTLVMLGLPK